MLTILPTKTDFKPEERFDYLITSEKIKLQKILEKFSNAGHYSIE